ncbi:MAG: ABC transporter ATP-binding protein [Candidatus Dormibacteria bacterium]
MIRVENLRKAYRGHTAVEGLSFEIAQGEIYGFVGPNGAGKTTTLRILATLLRPSAGRALVGGVDVIARPRQVRDLIGYMPDFFGVYDRLTAAEYLAFYANCYQVPRTRRGKVVADLLELMNLGDKRDTEVNGLSRGMKQRLCLARALVHDPAVLLLDEPASGLDPRAQVEMRELLRELRSMGKTILISSHNLRELTEMCTAYGVIDGGHMVASGTRESLSAAAQGHPRVTVKVGGDPDDAARRATGVAGVIEVRRDEDSIVIDHQPESSEGQLLSGLIAAGVVVRAYTPLEENLEDVFMRITSEGAN